MSDEKKLHKKIFERMLEARTIPVFGAIDRKVADTVVGALFLLEAEDAEAPITVLLNSPGGSVSDGLAIYDAMRFINPRIRIICMGLTASIATIILLGADKEDRQSLPNTRFLIHQPLIPGSVFGPASDLEITAKEILKTRELLNKMLAEATGQPLERVEKDTHRDYWMSSDGAVEYGLIAGIVASRSQLD